MNETQFVWFSKPIAIYVFFLCDPTKAFNVRLRWLRVAEQTSRTVAERVMDFNLVIAKQSTQLERIFIHSRVTQ